jgi:hypothetical protein
MTKNHKDNPANHLRTEETYSGFNDQRQNYGQVANLEDNAFDDIGHAYDDILKNPEPDAGRIELHNI